MTDVRRGSTTLAAQAGQTLEQDPFAGHLDDVRGRRGDPVEIVPLWGQCCAIPCPTARQGVAQHRSGRGPGGPARGACPFSRCPEKGVRRVVLPPDGPPVRRTVRPAAEEGKVSPTAARSAMLLEGEEGTGEAPVGRFPPTQDWRAPQRDGVPLEAG